MVKAIFNKIDSRPEADCVIKSMDCKLYTCQAKFYTMEQVKDYANRWLSEIRCPYYAVTIEGDIYKGENVVMELAYKGASTAKIVATLKINKEA